MKGKKMITGVIMTMAVLGISLTAVADDTNAKKVEAGLEQQGAEESLIRDEDGRIVGIDVTLEPVSVYYQETDYEQLLSSEQFREYKKLGLTCDRETKTFYFHGMKVNFLEDEYEEGYALQYLTEKWGENSDQPSIGLYAVRDEDYHLLYFKFYRLLTYDFPYNLGEDEYGIEDEMWDEDEMAVDKFTDPLEEDEYGIEDEMWDEDAMAVDEFSEPEEEAESLTFIGGEDEPTEHFLKASEDENEVVTKEEQIRNLYACKANNTEDARALSNMVHSLLEMGLMPVADFSVDMKEDGSCMEFLFKDPLPDTDETILNLSDCGNIFLALVDELSEVRFTYREEQKREIQDTVYWDEQAARESLNEDVKEYGKSLNEFIKLFNS